ncbi:Hypothetical protein TES1_0073 [Thermococcus paralvinellae]|uniref:Lipoprotein n=2 Tax=Thermococcus paralvinellae TaxID=582419 RepID=W0I4W6_9EURY|nr:Hypothetical protein TES1_0073 [Thermococcus paralvinellae]
MKVNILISILIVFILTAGCIQHQSTSSSESTLSLYGKYYIGDIPSKRTIQITSLPPLKYKRIRIYRVKDYIENTTMLCSKEEFVEIVSSNKSKPEFACINGAYGKVFDTSLKELWSLPKNSTVYYMPILIVRTPPPIEINETEYIIGVNALYYCTPTVEKKNWTLKLYYPSDEGILRFKIYVNASIVESFQGKNVLFALDKAFIKNNTVIAEYSPYCISP